MSSIRHILGQLVSQFESNYDTMNVAEISRSAILQNFDTLKELFGVEHIIPVLKSNAYGHGMEPVVSILEDREVPYVAVDSYHEALEIRAMSDFDVLVMGGVLPENFTKIDLRHTAYVVQDMSLLNVLTNMRRSIKIHLEFDTGMNRQGFRASELKNIIQILKGNDHIELDGVMSHFYDAANVDSTSVGQQVEAFDAIVAKIKKAGLHPKYIHLAKTSGIAEPASKYANTIRPGSGLYGVNPLPEDHKRFKDLEKLEPVMAVKSRLVKIREIEPGEGVGYNHTFIAEENTRIGVVPFGYAEGINEKLSNSGQLCFKGEPVPIIGKVSMNHTMVDLTNTKAKLWDKIEIISRDRRAPNSLKQLHNQHGIYQLVSLVRMSDDLRRVIVD